MDKIYYLSLLALAFTTFHANTMEGGCKRPATEEINQVAKKTRISSVKILCQKDNQIVEIPEFIAHLSQTINDAMNDAGNVENALQLNIDSTTLQTIADVLNILSKENLNDTSYRTTLRALENTRHILGGSIKELIATLSYLDLLSIPLIKSLLHAKEYEITTGLPFICHGFKSEQARNQLTELTEFVRFQDFEYQKDSALNALNQEIVDYCNQPIDQNDSIYKTIDLEKCKMIRRWSPYTAYMDGNIINIWDSRSISKTPVAKISTNGEYSIHYDNPYFAIDRDLRWIAFFDRNFTLHVLDMKTGKTLNQFNIAKPFTHFVHISSDNVSPNAEWVIIGLKVLGESFVYSIININTGEMKNVGAVKDELGWLTDRYLYIRNQNTCSIFDMKTSKIIRSLTNSLTNSVEFCFASDGQYIVSNVFVDSIRKVKIYYLDAAERIEHYFKNKITFDELVLIKKIAYARSQNKKYTLSNSEQLTFDRIGQGDEIVHKVLHTVLKRYIA